MVDMSIVTKAPPADSLTCNGPFCVVVNDTGAVVRKYWLSGDPNAGVKEVKCSLNEHFRIAPCEDRGNVEARTAIYAAGPAGVGKSRSAYMFAQLYRKQYPMRPIMLISRIANDPSLPLQPLDIRLFDTKTLIAAPFNVEEFKEAGGGLVIIDDSEGTHDKAEADAISKMVKDLGDLGRHERISFIFTTHALADYKRTKYVLGAANVFCLFPAATSSHQVRFHERIK